MIIATAGHVDHGKTTLIRALTGIDTDRLPEEKQRGMSIDLGFAYAQIAGRQIGFIDVPGHQKFMRNLLAGMPGIDFSLLIVATDDGVMPQTAEHVDVLDLLGVENGVVALSKIDRVDANRVNEVASQIRYLLKDTRLRSAPVLPVSAQTGDGIDQLREHLASVVEKFPERKPQGNFRLAIDRCFSLRGIGVTVTGTVFSGSAAIGETLLLSPAGVRVRVRSIHANDQSAAQASAGQRCAINIAAAGGDALNHHDISRGDWLVAPAAHLPTARLDARVRLLKSETVALKHWTSVHVHIGAAHSPGRIAMLEGRPLEPGANGLAQLVLDRQIGALRGDKVILRDASAQRAIGGGNIIDPEAPGRGRAKPQRLAFLAALERPSALEALSEFLFTCAGGASLDHFARIFNLTPAEASALWNQAPMRQFGRGADHTGIGEEHYAALLRRIPELLSQWHRDRAHILGPNEREILAGLQPLSSAALLNAVLRQLCSDGKIARMGTILHLPGHRVQPAASDVALWNTLRPMFDAAELTPPRIRELAAATGKTPEAIEALLTRLAHAGLVSRVSDNRFFTPGILRRLADIAGQAAASAEQGLFTAAEYRIRSSIGRNLTIEVLEYFDRAGFTRRIGAGRIIRSAAEDFFGA